MTGLKRRTQSERSAATQKALLDAAREVISVRGFAKMTMAEVATKAGVSRGALLHHYATKQDLLLAAVDYILTKVEMDVKQISKRIISGTDEDISEFICELWNRVFHPNNFAVNLELVIAARSNDALSERLSKRWVQLANAYHKTWIETLEQTGNTSPEAIALLPITVNFLRGMALQRIGMGVDQDYFSEQLERWTEVVKTTLRNTTGKEKPT